MKQVITIVLVIVTIISLIVVAFTISQTQQEQQRLSVDLQYRSTLLSENLKEAIEPNFINKSNQQLQSLVNKLDDKERFAGMALYDKKGNGIATSSGFLTQTSDIQKIAEDVMDADKANGDFIDTKDGKIYVLAVPIHNDTNIVGALMIAQKAEYIDNRINEIWKNNLLRLLIQASLLSAAMIVLIRWMIYRPIKNLVETLQSVRSGEGKQNPKSLTNSPLFRPLINEVSSIRRSLLEARSTASEEARLRIEKLDSPWTAERLKEFLKEFLKGKPIFVVAKREPYSHTKNGNKITYQFPANGVSTALEPLMQASGGTWIAHGSGNADKLVVDKQDKIKVPPDEPKYTLKRVWLTDEEVQGFDYGFSIEALYALCVNAYTRPIFRQEDWDQYVKVNQKFADVVLSEIKNQERPIVFIQDLHFALLPRMIKTQRPSVIIGLFWHIPWPNPESFSICPWKREILDGMLGADLIGFHTQLHCNNFIETVGREMESLIDFESFTVTKNNHTSFVKPFPISTDFPKSQNEQNHDFNLEREKILKDLGIKARYIGLGVERLDYIKGILEKLKAIEIFLSENPVYIGNFTFIQIAAPTKSMVKKYQEFTKEVEERVEQINSRFKKNGWKPIVLLAKYHTHEEIQVFYKLANFCLITSLQDGMNLVAKEFIAARDDEKGVLILSQYTGASRELKDALIINPYHGTQTATAIKQALEMKITEQSNRMHNMREVVRNYNIYRWAAEFLRTLVNLG